MTPNQLAAFLPAVLKTRGAALAVVALLQIGALATMVADRVRLVRNGREIVLPITPVDPRDLFKGDYVQLGFPITLVPGVAVEKPLPRGASPAFATIERQADESWKVVALAAARPGTVSDAQVVLQARPWSRDWANWSDRVRYGIERYYVPEGTGGALENLARDKKLAAIVAVDNNGNAAIKGLMADGKRVYDEPLF